jgi:hypothetical protein
MKTRNIICSLFLAALCSCSLDYENSGTINPDNVWKDKAMISSFLSDIYGRMMPGWPISANNTDEGMNGPASMGEVARGIITIDNYATKWGYDNIDRINFFLDQLEIVTVLTEEEKKQMKGQALFWRARDYWGKVFATGGVPLILHFQDVTDLPSLFVSRNSTTECVEQIIKDLDEAIALLPDKWEGADYGRIDKGAAMAQKGRILLQYARPLFNPNNDQSRWEAAYKANKDAVDFLQSVGKGLYQGKFEDIWYDEGKHNSEVVMATQFIYPDHKFDQKSIRPQPLTKDGANDNQAILSLLLAFPKADGTPLELDVNRLAMDAAYNEQFLNDFYMNRDPRFHATIFCPGTQYPCSDKLPGEMKYWNTWKKIADPEAPTGEKYVSMAEDEMGVTIGGNSSGYFQKKGLDKDLTSGTVYDADVDWIEFRFAEVLMNYGECANELGKSGEALQVLYDIRKRAGIINKDGKYGITATSQNEIREAYMTERLIEFAYEGKRDADLRSWKRYDILNKMKYRSSLYAVIKDKDQVANFDWTKDMSDPEIRKMFRFEYVECVDQDKKYAFNMDLSHWFHSVAKETIDRNENIEQNLEWGGSFDPLK